MDETHENVLQSSLTHYGDLRSSPPSPSPHLRLFLQWTAATAGGMMASLAIGAFLSQFMRNTFYHYSPADDLQTILSVGASSAIGGLAIGAAQWLPIKHRLPGKLGIWLLSTTVGWGCLAAVAAYLETLQPAPDFYGQGIVLIILWDCLKGSAGGAALGVAQWIALGPRVASFALWVPANMLALGAVVSLDSWVIRTLGFLPDDREDDILPIVLVGLASILLYAGILGSVLVRLFQKQSSQYDPTAV